MTLKTLAQQETALLKLIEEKFSLRKGGVGVRLRKIGRRVPKRIRKAGKEVENALLLATHPKLSQQIDFKRVDKAFRDITRYLTALDMADKRKGALLSMLGGVSFNMLMIVALLIALLVWRGLV